MYWACEPETKTLAMPSSMNAIMIITTSISMIVTPRSSSVKRPLMRLRIIRLRREQA